MGLPWAFALGDAGSEVDIIEQLLRDEGEVLHAYRDGEGYWTIGVGHLIDKRRGGGISQRISRLILEEDVESCKWEVHVRFPWFNGLNLARQGVMLNMAFNLGIAGLSGFHNFLSCMGAGDWEGAAQEMLRSKWAAQVGERAERLAAQVRSGQWT